MHEKDNYLKTAELSTEQNCNMIDGVPNNTPIQPTPPEPVSYTHLTLPTTPYV